MRYGAAVEEAISGAGPDKIRSTKIGRDKPHGALRRQGYICDLRQMQVNAPAAQVFAVLQGVGGKSGWPYTNPLWQLRGQRWIA